MKRFLKPLLGVAILTLFGCGGGKKSLPVTLFKAMETGDSVRVETASGAERYKQGDAVHAVVSVIAKHRSDFVKTDLDASTLMDQLTILKNNNVLGRFKVQGSDLFYGDKEIWKTTLTSSEASALQAVIAP